MSNSMNETASALSGLVGASDDDPLIKVDERRRISLGKLAVYRHYLATVYDGQILLTPCRVSISDDPFPPPDAHAEIPRFTVRWVNERKAQGPTELMQVDRRNRISLGALGRLDGVTLYDMYLTTVQPESEQLLLTPVMIMPVHLEELISRKRTPKTELTPRTLRPRQQ